MPVDGKTTAPPVSRVDKAPETATKLLKRIAVATEKTEIHAYKTMFWVRLLAILAVVVPSIMRDGSPVPVIVLFVYALIVALNEIQSRYINDYKFQKEH